MLKILLVFLIAVQLLILPLIVFLASGISILLPGLGLVVDGMLFALPLFLFELGLLALTVILLRHLRKSANKLL